MRSVSFGIWVGVGSRDETPALSGVSHFLEHLLFKGTQQALRAGHLRGRSRRSAARPTRSPPRSTPATTRGCSTPTCRWPSTSSATLVADSVLGRADVETERGVILEEIAMHDDEPGDEVHDLFAEAIYGDHPLGRLISGTVETISPMTRRADPRLLPPALHAAGDRGRRGRQPRPRDRGQAGPRGASPAPPLDDGAGRARRRPRPAPRRSRPRTAGDRGARQGHRAGAPRARRRRPSAAHDERRFALGVLNNVLGGGMSSRLFQEIREKRGLAYSVYSYTSQYADAGAVRRLRRLRAGQGRRGARPDPRRAGPGRRATASPPRSCARGKGMLKGSLVLGLEDTGSRMSRLGKGELLYDELLSVDELLRPGRRGHRRTRSARSPPSCSARADVAGRDRPVRRPRLRRRRDG